MLKRSSAIFLSLILVLSLVFVPAHAASYVANWGQRGVHCSELSSYANAYYTGDYSIATLNSYAGGTSQSNAPSSALYSALKSMMTSKHTYQTSYDATKSLYMYTDCQNGNTSTISSFYSGISLNSTWGSGWNREHTWPNSKGLEGRDEDDIMMLRPTSTSENSSRGNKAYGTVTNTNFYNPNDESNGQYDLRGDVARICLYQYTRWGNTGYMWGASGVMESLDVLINWMTVDPVDTWEMGRNDAVQSITGVRNVYVDYPELGFKLFGREVPENYASPSNGVIPEGGTTPTPTPTPTYNSVSNPTTTDVYKLYFDQKGVGKVLFATETLQNNKYIVMTQDATAALDFMVEQVTDGYKFYTTIGGAKKYLVSYLLLEEGKTNKSKYIGFDDTGSVYTYNSQADAWLTTIEGVEYTIGTYNSYETMSTTESSYLFDDTKKSSQYPARLVLKSEAENPGSTTPDPEDPEQGGSTGGNEPEDPGLEPGESTTLSLSIEEYATANNWASSIQYPTINADANITITASSGTNTGKYYYGATYGHQWRLYQSESASVTFAAKEGYNINSVKVSYEVTNTGTLTLNGTPVASNEVVTVNADSVTLTTGNTGSATNGQVRITNIEVSYTAEDGSTGGETPDPEQPGTGGGETPDPEDPEQPGGETPDPTPSETTTVSVIMSEYATANAWANSQKYLTANLDSNITATVGNSGNNSGKWYDNGSNWRIYQTENSTLTISSTDKTIVSVKVTYDSYNTGTLTLNGANVASNDVVAVNANSVTFGLGNTGTASNGQARITAIEVVYAGGTTGGGETPDPEDPEQPGGETPDPEVPAYAVVDTPVAGTAYKFGMIQQNVSTTDVYYINGAMSSYYMATTTDASAAVDVYLEETTGGYYLYAMVGGAKKYINMVVSGTHVNGAFEDTASTVYTYDATSKTVISNVSEVPYWFGTRNDNTYTTVGPVKTEYNGFYLQFYAAAGSSTPENPGGGEDTDIPMEPCDHVYDNECDTTCNECGEVRVAPHKYGEWTETTPGTCTTPGVETRYCENDASHFETRTGSTNANNHVWGDWEITRDPSCTDAGEQQRVCTENSAHVETKEVGVDDDAHAWGDWEVTRTPTCVDAGEKKRVCLHDATHIETDVVGVDNTVHSYDDEYDAECNDCGAIREVPERPILGDIDGKNGINNSDLIMLRRYLAGWGVEINEEAANLDGKGGVNNSDAIWLARYLAGWDGYVLE